MYLAEFVGLHLQIMFGSEAKADKNVIKEKLFFMILIYLLICTYI